MNGKWFFQTRAEDHGPYLSRDAAALDMQRYVEEMAYLDETSDGPARLTTRDPDDLDSSSFTLVDKN